MVEQKKPSCSWWFDSHKNQRNSPWLSSALSELEENTKGILKLIEEDADSFAQRAEMYYKKRPELISLIEILYRSHRSLAEQYDQLRVEARLHRTTSFNSAFSERSWSMKVRDELSKSSGSSLAADESEQSEIDDPEQEEEEEIQWKADNEKLKMDNQKLKTENEKLKTQNESLKAELPRKDEEKREAIRQLCLSMNLLREENDCLKNHIKQSKKWTLFDFKKIKKGVLTGKLFGGNA
ncbi:hypothetical protein J5N97_013150 [Dioscorea zingiberensis]|uniref:NAB domain-containing protein n=1 Tax=Dioscorea zingiberensis TaxID=325984 RepID=A0A9D5CQ60_9LILI|nr:hypothetical protein J5N97_013150 [Dioscorea zingiberensis]